MEGFNTGPHPDHPGWQRWELAQRGLFNDVLGTILARPGDDGRGHVRMVMPERRHANLMEAIHGGALLAFIDVAMFAGARMCGVGGIVKGQTIDCSAQFISPGRLSVPLDATVELLRETYRMVFVRGLLEQEGRTVAAFSGTFKKASASQ